MKISDRGRKRKNKNKKIKRKIIKSVQRDTKIRKMRAQKLLKIKQKIKFKKGKYGGDNFHQPQK